MPTLNENRRIWQQDYDWSNRGDEWSEAWGGEDAQWYGAVLPRVHSFVTNPDGSAKAQTILEIAPGFGRWTKYLIPLCQRLIVVDLASKCIEACRQRFKACSHIEYHQNDGKSLAVVPDAAIDFVFSMDSLVHADEEVMDAYMRQLASKLTPQGVAFLHHSNFGEFSALFGKIPDHNRSRTTARQIKGVAEAAGLRCLSQEFVNWGGTELIDALSVFARADSDWKMPYRSLKNGDFMNEAGYWARLAQIYGRRSVGTR